MNEYKKIRNNNNRTPFLIIKNKKNVKDMKNHTWNTKIRIKSGNNNSINKSVKVTDESAY